MRGSRVLGNLAKTAHLSRAVLVRAAVIAILLLMAALSWYPLGASVSGALDRVLFDATSQWFAHPSAGKVAVVLMEPAQFSGHGGQGLNARSAELLRRLDGAASVTLDYALPEDSHAGALAAGMVRHGAVVLPVPGNGGFELIESMPAVLNAAAAGRGQRYLRLGHYGVVTGFMPVHDGRMNIVLEAIRAAGVPHAYGSSIASAHRDATSIAASRTPTTFAMLGGPERVDRYAFSDVVDGKVPASALAGRMVFVGDRAGADAGFRISSLNARMASRAELDALMADAVLSDNLVGELPGAAAVSIYLALALGMILICARVHGRLMHAAALGWFAVLLLMPVAVLGFAHRWLGLGLLPLVCVLIYAHFAWDRLHRTHRLLQLELGRLRSIAAEVGGTGADLETSLPSAQGPDTLRRLRRSLQEIRNLQGTFAGMINQLPHAVFAVVGGRISVWNARAAEILTARDGGQAPLSLEDVQAWVNRHGAGCGGASEEIVLEGRAHRLIQVPYASMADDADSDAARDGASYLVCLMDIADIKEGVAHDKQALRHVAHDLRAPLSTILSLVEERANDGRSGSSQERHFLEDLRRQADYSLRVAKDFLQLSRAEQIAGEALAPVALLDIAAEAVDQLWLAAQAKSIELAGPECALEDTLVRGHADMLIRAVVNVIENAIKYSPPHTRVTLRIGDGPDGYLALHVTDQGMGIAPDHLQRLAQPFFQVDGSGGVEAGVGLGLAFVKTVLERHGGSMSVSSRPGEGAVFRFLLPRLGV